MNNDLLKKLQPVQHCAARLVSKQMIPSGGLDKVMMNFHWLKVKFRPVYMILDIVHNSLHVHAPNEIIALLEYADSARTMELHEKRVMSKYGERAFSHYAPKLWNLLPQKIRDNTTQNSSRKSSRHSCGRESTIVFFSVHWYYSTKLSSLKSEATPCAGILVTYWGIDSPISAYHWLYHRFAI